MGRLVIKNKGKDLLMLCVRFMLVVMFLSLILDKISEMLGMFFNKVMVFLMMVVLIIVWFCLVNIFWIVLCRFGLFLIKRMSSGVLVLCVYCNGRWIEMVVFFLVLDSCMLLFINLVML